jgi:hypothetical protein
MTALKPLPPPVAEALARLLAGIERHDQAVVAGVCRCTACQLAREAGHRPRPPRQSPKTAVPIDAAAFRRRRSVQTTVQGGSTLSGAGSLASIDGRPARTPLAPWGAKILEAEFARCHALAVDSMLFSAREVEEEKQSRRVGLG